MLLVLMRSYIFEYTRVHTLILSLIVDLLFVLVHADLSMLYDIHTRITTKNATDSLLLEDCCRCVIRSTI